ncbi:hypothetical protein NX868_12625 [Burkholderia thailandensis]|uniref:Lipoprotein n=1 Tax=Burkholderia thailandensis TaxID=57975 RepID=A0AAW9D668_BURTH|nr:hypothetical protein [Burkholderia thailandensis]MCS3392746.1 hypothetical protein [Burkholderia thailandensis]MCS6425974.1 hypothetical protein [Burkholderia thailandensis]MCS6454033.1 hypothetical protein [Burkholderia thailandensis]MCS6465217.1 hypothetical protein [Burkholderia thailandensis]MCS6483117.1 hypothetical protein [Burkholderia thailandensis]
MKNKLNTGITRLALGASMCAALAACGGGGSDNSSTGNPADNTPSVTTSGTAAIGAPIVGGAVSLKCASGATATATTGSDGSWTVSLKSTDYPCAVRVSDGLANGAALAAPLHSAAIASGTTNITPLTDLEVGVLGKGDPETWFNGAKNGDLSGAITSGNLADALTKLTNALATLPGKPALPHGFNPLTTSFKAAKGDAGDNLLESYGAALTAAGLSQSDAAVKTASGTALTQAAYSAMAYTTGASYTTDPVSIQMGSSVNLDGTFGIAVADPNRGQYTAKASIDANGNVTSFTDAGQFTAIVSLLGNRVGQLCTVNGAGGATAFAVCVSITPANIVANVAVRATASTKARCFLDSACSGTELPDITRPPVHRGERPCRLCWWRCRSLRHLAIAGVDKCLIGSHYTIALGNDHCGPAKTAIRMLLRHDTEVAARLAIALAGGLLFDMVVRGKRLGLPRICGVFG